MKRFAHKDDIVDEGTVERLPNRSEYVEIVCLEETASRVERIRRVFPDIADAVHGVNENLAYLADELLHMGKGGFRKGG